MPSGNWRDAIAVASLALTAAGIVVTIVALFIALAQLQKAKETAERAESAADAARKATEETRASMIVKVQLHDLVSAGRLASELREKLRVEDLKPALERITPLRTLIIQIRDTSLATTPTNKKKFQSMITSLTSIEDAIDSKFDNPGIEWDKQGPRDFARDIEITLQELEVQARKL